MKKTLAFLMSSALFLTLNAQPTELTGAFGLSFGCSKQDAKEMMRSKHSDAVIYQDKPESITYTGGTWAGRECAAWIFAFTDDNKLHTATVLLKPLKDDAIFDLYESVSKDMIGKYGEPKSKLESWKYPYEASDKYKHGVVAIKNGKTHISHFWSFPAGESNTEDDNNTIQVKITDSCWLSVKYQNGVLIDQAIAEDAKKNQGEM